MADLRKKKARKNASCVLEKAVASKDAVKVFAIVNRMARKIDQRYGSSMFDRSDFDVNSSVRSHTVKECASVGCDYRFGSSIYPRRFALVVDVDHGEALAPQAITRTEQRLLIIHLILLCVKSGLAVSASGTLLSIGTYRGEGGIQQQQLPAFYVSRLRFIFL
jgi:hypothetical protein